MVHYVDISIGEERNNVYTLEMLKMHLKMIWFQLPLEHYPLQGYYLAPYWKNNVLGLMTVAILLKR